MPGSKGSKAVQCLHEKAFELVDPPKTPRK